MLHPTSEDCQSQKSQRFEMQLGPRVMEQTVGDDVPYELLLDLRH